MDTGQESQHRLGATPSRRQLGRLVWIFCTATTLSYTGSFAQRIAVGWSVWELTQSTAWVAAAALADLVPTLILSVPAGAIIDRFRPATTFWISQAASALQAFVLFGFAYLGNLTIGALIAGAIFLGMCNAFTLPARLAFVTQLIPRESYARVVALFSLAGNIAFFAGPMIASALISAIGVAAAFGANALAYIPLIILMGVLRKAQASFTNAPVREPLLEQIYGGFAYTLRNKRVLAMLLSFAAAACTARGIVELAPSIAATVLHGSVETLSLLASSFALGGLVAGVWMAQGGSLPDRTITVTTLSGSALALVGYGALGQLWLALASAVLLGVMLAANNMAVTSAIQLYSAPQFRGRVNSLYNLIFKGGTAVGAALFGSIAQWSSVPLASSVAAILLIVLMVWIVGWQPKRNDEAL